MLVGTNINKERKNTFTLQFEERKMEAHFNSLHSSFGNDRLLDNSISIHLVILGNRLSLILGLAGKNKSVRAIEVSLGVNLTNSLLLNTLNLLSSSRSYNDVRKQNAFQIFKTIKTVNYLDFP